MPKNESSIISFRQVPTPVFYVELHAQPVQHAPISLFSYREVEDCVEAPAPDAGGGGGGGGGDGGGVGGATGVGAPVDAVNVAVEDLHKEERKNKNTFRSKTLNN